MLRHLGSRRGLSRSAVRRLIERGRVVVNGTVASRAAQRLASGDAVEVAVASPPPRTPRLGEPGALHVLYEDDDLLVVVKPPGVVVHPTRAVHRGTLLNALTARAAGAGAAATWTPHLVQRLDKDTSGLLAVAKSSRAHAALQRAAADTIKEYLAVVWGATPGRGTLDAALGRDPLDRRRVMARASGAPARTTYVRLARTGGNGGLSLLACRLVTGRTHQIRVHLADGGWPLVGDPVYGRPPRRRLDDVLLDRAARTFPRQALHAWRLTLPLPGSGRTERFEAPLPVDLTDLLATAGLTVPRA